MLLLLNEVCIKTLELKNTLISFKCAGTPAMLRSEVNDTNTNMAATLVCNSRGGEKENESLIRLVNSIIHINEHNMQKEYHLQKARLNKHLYLVSSATPPYLEA